MAERMVFTREADAVFAAALAYVRTKERLYGRPVPRGRDAEYARLMTEAEDRLMRAAEPFLHGNGGQSGRGAA